MLEPRRELTVFDGVTQYQSVRSERVVADEVCSRASWRKRSKNTLAKARFCSRRAIQLHRACHELRHLPFQLESLVYPWLFEDVASGVLWSDTAADASLGFFAAAAPGMYQHYALAADTIRVKLRPV